MEEIMYAKLYTEITIDDKPTPKYYENINEYETKLQTKDILRAILVNAATEFAINGQTKRIDEFINNVGITIEKDSRPTWKESVNEDARNIVRELTNEIVEYAIDNGEVNDDINSYPKAIRRIKENELDWMQADEVIELLNELYEHEETDSSLYDVGDYRDMLSAKAHYTYQNALFSEVSDILNDIANEANNIISDIEDAIYDARLDEGNRVVEITDRIKEMIDDETTN
jgi:hypothetical protein